jgi:hypothetical protein
MTARSGGTHILSNHVVSQSYAVAPWSAGLIPDESHSMN